MAQRTKPEGVLDVVPGDPAKRILANQPAYQNSHGAKSGRPSASTVAGLPSPVILPPEQAFITGRTFSIAVSTRRTAVATISSVVLRDQLAKQEYSCVLRCPKTRWRGSKCHAFARAMPYG